MVFFYGMSRLTYVRLDATTISCALFEFASTGGNRKDEGWNHGRSREVPKFWNTSIIGPICILQWCISLPFLGPSS